MRRWTSLPLHLPRSPLVWEGGGRAEARGALRGPPHPCPEAGMVSPTLGKFPEGPRRAGMCKRDSANVGFRGAANSVS